MAAAAIVAVLSKQDNIVTLEEEQRTTHTGIAMFPLISYECYSLESHSGYFG